MLVSKIPAGVLRAFGNNVSRRTHRDKLRSPIEINARPFSRYYATINWYWNVFSDGEEMAVECTKRNRKPGVWRCYTGPHTFATYTVDCCTTEIAVAFCPGSLSFFGCSAYTTCSLARTTIASGTGWRTACTRTWHRLEQRRINYMYYAANYCSMPAFES